MTKHQGRHFLNIPGPSPVPDRVLRAMDMPVIDHRNRSLRALWLLEHADVSSYAHYFLRLRLQPDERLVTVVVDVGEKVEQPVAQLAKRYEEPAVARLGTEAIERAPNPFSIVWRQRPERHLAAIAELDGLTHGRTVPRPEGQGVSR